MDQELEQLVKAPFLTVKEQRLLLDILEKEGETEFFYQKAQELLEAGVKRDFGRAQEAQDKFDQEAKQAQERIEKEQEALRNEMGVKLNEIDINDIKLFGQISDSYYEKIFALYRQLENEIRDIAAKIMVEQIKTAE